MKFFLRLSVCFLLILIPGCGQAQAEKERVLDIQEVTSPGGITAWLVEDHTLPIIAVQFAFMGAGAALDPAEKQGLTLMVSNTMDEGAGEYDSATFQKLLTDNNISLSFSAGRDDFGGSLKFLTADKELAFKLLRLALNEPRFDEAPVARMRAANMTRIRSSLSDPEWKAARLLNDIAYADHPYALNTGGTLSTLAAITEDDLRAFATSRLGQDNLRIGIMGDITADELKAVMDDVFGRLPENALIEKVSDTKIQNGGETVLFEQDIPQTIINMMQQGIERLHPDYYTGITMNFILGGSGFGSRLTEEIREKRGLTYGISTYFNDLQHVQGLTVSTSTKNESVAELLKLIDAEWRRMQNEPVTDAELANAKSYLIGSFPLSLNSTDNIASIILSLQLDDLPIDYLDKRDERINAVTKEDIQNLAKWLLTPDKMTTVLVGKPQDVTPTRTVDKLPNVE